MRTLLALTLSVSSSSVAASQEREARTDYVRIELSERAVFRTTEGDAAPLEPGSYLVVVSRNPPLTVLPMAAGTRPWTLEATEVPHDEPIAIPVAEVIPGSGDEVHLVLFLPGRRALGAVGSLTGRVPAGPVLLRPRRREDPEREPRREEPSPIRRPVPPPFDLPSAGGDGVEAANELLALPWDALGRQTAADAEAMVEEALGGRVLAKAEGLGDIVNVVDGHWMMSLRVADVNAEVDLSAPPGFRHVGPDGFAIELPHGGRWSFAVSGDVEGRAFVDVAGQRIFSWRPQLLHFGLRVWDLRVTAGALLDPADPSRPKLVTAFVSPELRIGGRGFIPITIPVDFQLEKEEQALILRAPLVDLPVALPPLGARFRGELVITLWLPAVVSDMDARPRTQRLDLGLRGVLSFELPLTGRREADFVLSAPYRIPVLSGLNEALSPLEPPLPKVWGEGEPLGETPPPPADVDLATPALEMEEALVRKDPDADIVSHLPWGGIFSVDQRVIAWLPCPSGDCTDVVLSYGGEGDSAIWTGHYLAAEAFRWAATEDPAAMERLRAVLAGVKRLFDVTSGTAVDGGRRVAVTTGGLLSRFARPAGSPIDFTDMDEQSLLDGERGCYYEYREGFFPGPGTPARAPGPTLWFGWGCGGRSPFERSHFTEGGPISRDQYAGVFLGLGFVHELVPELRDSVRPLVENALDLLLDNDWNLPLPPEGRITTSFFGNLEKQLALLLVGKTVHPAKYASHYDRYSAASSALWVPLWFSALDPMMQYFKFNLAHASMGLNLYFEDDPEIRDELLRAYGILRRATAHHKNAYFNALRILVESPERRQTIASDPSGSNPDISLAEEIESLLAEWLERRERVAGENGLPRNLLGDLSYQARLRPSHVGIYRTLSGNEVELATYALPIWARRGNGMDFLWQRQPFGVIASDCYLRRGPGPRPPSPDLVIPAPDAESRRECGYDSRKRETPAVDYLLPYWIGTYLGVFDR